MGIKIDDKVSKYLSKKKQNSIIVDVVKSKCCVDFESSSVLLGKPKGKSISNYEEVIIDGISIYFGKDVAYKEKDLVFKLQKGIFMSEIIIKGLANPL
ncbi:MAG: hypothetical protein N4A76_11170 [Firmicutes bacterium]|jgi:hypothetical protein|nr:hypothetical protein [Bacillota bacterium]